MEQLVLQSLVSAGDFSSHQLHLLVKGQWDSKGKC